MRLVVNILPRPYAFRVLAYESSRLMYSASDSALRPALIRFSLPAKRSMYAAFHALPVAGSIVLSYLSLTIASLAVAPERIMRVMLSLRLPKPYASKTTLRFSNASCLSASACDLA